MVYSTTLQITSIGYPNRESKVFRVVPDIKFFRRLNAYLSLRYPEGLNGDNWIPQLSIPTNAEMEGSKLHVLINLAKYFALMDTSLTCNVS